MPLGPQLLALQALIVLSCVVLAGFAAVSLQQRQIRDAYAQQMLAVATNAATLPDVIEAYEQPGGPGDDLQDLANLLQQASKVSFVVFLDRDGIRLSHPDPALIGSPSTTSAAEVLEGKPFVGTQTRKVHIVCGAGDGGEGLVMADAAGSECVDTERVG